MIYRRTRAADRQQVRAILLQHGIVYDEREPLVGFVAEHQEQATGIGTGQLVGFGFAHKCAIIDPFVCPEPVPAMKIFYQMMGGLSVLDINTVVVQTAETNLKLNKELLSLGFAKVEARYQIFKKII